MSDYNIEKQGDVYRIKGTRVAIDSVIYQFQQGRSPEAIQDAFPALSLSQVYGAIAYYLDNQTQIDQYLANQEAREEEISKELARLFPKGAALKEQSRQSLPEPTK
jgi:uncharacterized protein (DUF433 family)